MKFIKQLDNHINSFIKTKGVLQKDITWKTTISEDVNREHLSSNCVFTITKQLKTSPTIIGKEIEQYLIESKIFEKVSFVEKNIDFLFSILDIEKKTHMKNIEQEKPKKKKNQKKLKKILFFLFLWYNIDI